MNRLFENLLVQSLWKPGLLLVDLHWKLFITSFALLQKFSDLSESSQSIYTSQHHAQGASWEKFIIRILVIDSAKYFTLPQKKTKKQTGTTCDGMQMYGFWLVIQLYAWLVNLSLSPSSVLLLYSSDIFFVRWFRHDPSKFLTCGWIFNDICELRGKRSAQRGWLDYLVNLHQLLQRLHPRTYCLLGQISNFSTNSEML